MDLQANSVGIKGKSHLFRAHGKTQAREMVLLGLQREQALTVVKRQRPLPHKLFSRYCFIWQMAILEQGKTEK